MSVLDNARFKLSANKVADVNTTSLEEASAFFETNWGEDPQVVVELDNYWGIQFTIKGEDGGIMMLQEIPVSSLDEDTIEAIKAVTSALEG